MAVFRIERTRDYTVMSNHHLRNANLSLKAKGLLSMMLSLPEDWNYTTRGLAKICKEGVDAIGAALRELEGAGYIVRHQRRDKSGRITDTEYVIYEQPQPDMSQPDTASPDTENPDKERRLNVVDVLEEVVSGESLSSRPKMLRLLELVNTGMYAGVICIDMMRWIGLMNNIRACVDEIVLNDIVYS